MSKTTELLLRATLVVILSVGLYVGYQNWVASVYATANQAIQQAKAACSGQKAQ